MKNKNILPIATLLFIISIASSCANLKQVNDYSSKSLTGIGKFEEINYGFKQHCIDECQFNAVRNFDIKREPECNCSIYETADSVTLLIYKAIKGYFGGLTNLSDNALANYDFDALKKSLTEGDFGSIKIETADVKAYSAISTILLHATTDIYRLKKLKEYIEQANGPIQVLINKFQYILQQNLEGELSFKKEKLYTYYKEMSFIYNAKTIQDSTNRYNMSEYEKGKATIDYYQQLSIISQTQKQIDAFAKGLKSIADGHQKLYENRNKLNTKELKELIIQYSNNIQDLISEFNKLKNK